MYPDRSQVTLDPLFTSSLERHYPAVLNVHKGKVDIVPSDIDYRSRYNLFPVRLLFPRLTSSTTGSDVMAYFI